ncbi:uncharacterized protein SCHCODRAFT_02690755 [Schizophyllum commune H4-8]|nr:uncharacterized protein SCHCODRAFT_02690755 [Schizophyllum commune H4-8]KAI5890875.1 hypothetical protein SCHCODRAFT_02690755 [Schizophyllum commune H4-8]
MESSPASVPGADLLRRNKGFISAENGHFLCSAGCPNKKPMPLSKALEHDEAKRHIENVRRMARLLRMGDNNAEAVRGDDSQSPASSPPRVAHPVFTTIPPFETLQGPQLPHDNPLSIYDDYDGVWLPSAGPRQPEDAHDVESLFEGMPGLHEISDSSDSESDIDSASEGESEADEEEAVTEGKWGPSWRESPRTPTPEHHREAPSTPLPRQMRGVRRPPSPPSSSPDMRATRPDPADLSSDEEGANTERHRYVEPQTAGQSRLFHPENWWPWDDKEAALGAQMSGFPRSVFSEQDMKTALWLAEQCGAPISMTLRQIKLRRDKIVKDFAPGVDDCDGSLGNPYSMLSIADILADEWANPHVRPHVSVLSEDAGERLTSACNADKWYKDVDAVLSGPMVCSKDGQHYYVLEPALMQLSRPSPDSVQPEVAEAVVLPARWYTRNGDVWARAKRLAWVAGEPSLLVDEREDCVDIPLTSFLASYPRLKSTHHFYGIPDPSIIGGTIRRSPDSENSQPVSIDRTAAFQAPHPLRVKARGKQIFSVPIWVYCDDMSGNTSKKWNKHNSILFTLAGLPPRLAHLLYNIHFLSTSNLAAPLEMFERLVKSVQEIREQGGVEVYDCHLKTVVLLLPWVLGMAGDNPMQSEFASHIGLTGKCFCRVCNVRGADSKARPGGDEGERERVAEFMFGDSKPLRTKAETLDVLGEQLAAVLDGAPTRAGTIQTETGVKDKFFTHFFDLLAEECARVKDSHKDSSKTPQEKSAEVIAAIRVLRDSLPEDIFSPCLRLEEFDPAVDTPVEILHVVLLGFVKYFWRDAVSRLTREQKSIVRARIDSFDPTGLGIPHPRGQTLVQWAGSLTGRDFRVILQMAPTILQGLLPPEVYEAWLALGRLAPLAFQASIKNKSDYFRLLEEAVYDFLACSALWTTQWFNKPKFHSYNFVIRLRSIHSPRHAPSTDIARSFANMHMIRHFASSGFVKGADGTWKTAGSEITKLVDNPLYAKLVGLADVLYPQVAGAVSIDRKRSPTTWFETSSARSLPSPPSEIQNPISDAIRYCRKVVLANKDEAITGGFVLYQSSISVLAPRIGRVCEILATPQQVLGLLIQPYVVGQEILPYRMPRVSIQTQDSPDGSNPIIAAAEWCAVANCLASIHTFHNCAANRCEVTRTRLTKKERRLMQDKVDKVLHSQNPDDRVLNLAQLRSAEALHAFRSATRYPSAAKARDELVREAVEHRQQVDAEKAKKAGEKGSVGGSKGKNKRSAPAQSGKSRNAKRARTSAAAAASANSHQMPDNMQIASPAASPAYAITNYGYLPPSSMLPPSLPSTPSLSMVAARRAAQNLPAHLQFNHSCDGTSDVGGYRWPAPPDY